MHYDLTPSEIDRFWSKIDRDGPIPEHCPVLGPCWVWIGTRVRGGYGQVNVNRLGRPYAHRVSWSIHFGEIPDGMHVLHHCGYPPCCRPGHLFAGTPTDNLRDMARKERGRNQVGARFNTRDVLEIKARYAGGESQHSIARSLGTYQGVISNIISGRTWKHLVTP
jgi:hypothetical protein